MICPSCEAYNNSKVTDSRPRPWGVWRRRECLKCGEAWTTEERISAPRARPRAPWREPWLAALRDWDMTAWDLHLAFKVDPDVANERLRVLRREGLVEVVATVPPRIGHGRRQNVYRLTNKEPL